MRRSLSPRRHLLLVSLTATAAVPGCGGKDGGKTKDAATALRLAGSSRYVSEVVSFKKGNGGGFGSDRLPQVVQGGPQGGGERGGSLDVLSLGIGGSIVLSMGLEIQDGPGPDFLVFENPFRYAKDLVFSEPGRVSVSPDGREWHAFPCADQRSAQGCAGFQPVLLKAVTDLMLPIAWPGSGGDAFDLSTIGVKRARFVKLEDLSEPEEGDAGESAGFDLDAVGVLNGG